MQTQFNELSDEEVEVVMQALRLQMEETKKKMKYEIAGYNKMNKDLYIATEKLYVRMGGRL